MSHVNKPQLITLLLVAIICLLPVASSQAQDVIERGDLEPLEEFQANLQQKFPFGKILKKSSDETNEAFVSRIFGSVPLHHGVFQLDDFRNCIVSFAAYDFQEQAVVIGILLEPINSKGEYRLLKTMEMASGCGNEPKVNSVFLHNADPNSVGRELVIHASEYCGIHGSSNYVFVYNGLLEQNKLVLTHYLSERCAYSEIKINGEWDFDMGDEDVEDRRYIECQYSDFKAIRKVLSSK